MTGWAQKTRSGFTIVELLIVVVVIAILAAITIVSYNGITNRTRESNAATTLRNIAQKYDAELIQKGTQLTDTEFTALFNTITATGANQGINYGNSLQISSGIVTNFCAHTENTNTARFFVNSTDQKTPRKGFCTGGAEGQYTLQ